MQPGQPFSEFLRVWRHVGEGWRRVLEYGDWLLAAVWCVRTKTLVRRFPEVPDLTEVRWDLCPARAPGLVVVVPARDEAETLETALETLLAQEYPWLRVVAVDDRSRDRTGATLDVMAERRGELLSVLHVEEEAEGWVAKTFALDLGARQSRSEWLLFTEADVWFSPSVLRRALSYAEMSGADQLEVRPSVVPGSWGEKVLLGFREVLALWVQRPWRAREPNARLEAVGSGAFNLIRRDAWEELGGFAPQRLALDSALTLGRRVRAAGMRQRLVFAPGLVLQRSRGGLRGAVRRLSRGLWAGMNLRLWLAALSVAFVVLLFLAPLAGLLWWRTLLPSLLVIACVAVQFQVLSGLTGVEAGWGWLYPLGALVWLGTLVRSVAVTLWRGGVLWRGAVYPLGALRRWNSPFVWEFEAAKERVRERRVAREARRRTWLARRRGR